MMKKLFAAMLCLLLAAGCGHKTENKTYPSGVTYAQYTQKYAAAIDTLREEEGFLDAFLADVDNDTEPELLELIQKEEGIGSVVYAYFDGNMVRMDEFEDCVFDYGESRSEGWLGEDGLLYFYKTLADENEGINELYFFDGGIARETVHSCESIGGEYYIDGERASQQEYAEHVKNGCPKGLAEVQKKIFDTSHNKDKGKKAEKYWEKYWMDNK